MSLQIKLDRNQNSIKALFPKAVARIEKINSDDQNIRVEIGYYADSEARTLVKTDKEQNNPPMDNNYFIRRKTITLKMSEINELDFSKTDLSVEDVLKTACYLKLKQLDEFADATDI